MPSGASVRIPNLALGTGGSTVVAEAPQPRRSARNTGISRSVRRWYSAYGG